MIAANRSNLVSIRTDPASVAPTTERWLYHKTILQSYGISSLSSLGTLVVSGNIVPDVGGITIPSSALYAGSTLFQAVSRVARVDERVAQLEPLGGEARVLRAIKSIARVTPAMPAVTGATAYSAVASAGPQIIPIDRAYWAAQWINLVDDTRVVLKFPQMSLLLICERLTVGRNVVFTWEPQFVPVPRPQKPDRPKEIPAQPDAPSGIDGVPGSPGIDGIAGARGSNGSDAPSIEVWVLELSGSPIFDLRGQDGGPGGAGQDGGAGGTGSNGRPESYDFFGFCAKGAGSGGDGGPGGRGGNGGTGGNGGHGGRLLLQAPQAMLEQYGRGFYVSIDGGRGGPGGSHGDPGPGGAGGPQGSRPRNCAQSTPRHDGAAGPQGQPGADGAPGNDGGTFGADAIGFVAISADDFRRELTEPAIVTITPFEAHVGDRAVVDGLRFSYDDTLLIDGTVVTAKIVADTRIVFDVPSVTGGHHRVQVRQSDGTLSNSGTIYVVPTIASLVPSDRIRPGALVGVVGSGFTPDARIIANNQDMPDVTFIDSGRMTFVLTRPADVTPRPSGEKATIHVQLADGRASNTITVVIDTFRIVVMGDSAAWGQGLQEHEKYHSLVQNTLAAKSGGMGIYKTVLAHSGATIGIGDSVTMPAIDGEVPTSYPTILQQCLQPLDEPETVDLIILNGGVNDINVLYILNPTIRPADLVAAIDRHCRLDMTELLRAVTSRFSTATVVVTGYFPFVTNDSNTGLLGPFLTAIGVAVLGIPGGLTASQALPLVSRNCQIFYEQSTAALNAAVDQINEELESPRVVFANPVFTSDRAALTRDPWLFGLDPDFTIQDKAVGALRGPACRLNATRTTGLCQFASLGHPNVVGAQQYATAVLDALTRGASATRFSNLPDAPAGFLWGAGTAGYQVEGKITNNDWHVFTTSAAIKRRVAALTKNLTGTAVQLAPPGVAVKHSDIAVVADDLDRAKALGLNAYRFSIEWSRVQTRRPTRTVLRASDFSTTALTYYAKVIDECLKRGLEPIVTLNHLTLPSWVLTPPRESSLLSAVGWPTAVEDDAFKASMRGWESEETVAAFVRYVAFIVERFSKRVKWWLTLNEPVGSTIGVGYLAGLWPPGFNGDGERAKRAYFNLIKAHVRAYDAIKTIDAASHVGFAHNMMYAKTAVTAPLVPLDVEASATRQFDYFYNWHILDAVIHGNVDININHVAAQQKCLQGSDRSNFFGFDPSSAEPWHPRADFVGINYYRGVYVFLHAAVAAAAGYTGGIFENRLDRIDEPHGLLNSLGWEISPEGLGKILRAVHEHYGLPVIITENGIAESADELRAPFIVAHAEQLLAALADGVDVRGYIHWSLVDNYEWHEGYRPEGRFGLFGVNRADPALPRRLTEGALALQSIAADNNVSRQAERFGSISPSGDRVRPPSKSAVASFAGTIDSAPVVCVFERRKSKLLSGIASFNGGTELRRLTDVVWDDVTKNLSFRHVTKGGAARSYRVVVNDGRMTGTYEQPGVSGSIQLSRLATCGTWSGTSWWRRLKISYLGTELAGWVEQIGEQRKRWQRVQTVSWDGTAVTLDDGQARFVGAVTQRLMSGVLSVRTTGATGPWTATRQDDDVPF